MTIRSSPRPSLRPIRDVAEELGIATEFLETYGDDKAKVGLGFLDSPRARTKPAKLILVSAITPTPAGEGKTTTSIGLADALRSLGQATCLALREPSLGPCMGIKGGGTGGGACQVVPSDDINLHFTGDFHALTSAHNLLAAIIDNHLHFGGDLGVESRRVLWPRVLDMNDRSLRDVTIGLGGKNNGVPRQTRFDITAASELMAMLCLSEGFEDLRARIDRTLIAVTNKGEAVTAGQLGATGAMLALMKHAIKPNLVQTMGGTPAFVHGGPFANIAHGCNSVLATRMALHAADWVVTEAGFGFDLGAEKFYDIKCRSAGLATTAVVLVASVRALKMHGGQKLAELTQPNAEAVRRGVPNLEKHIENAREFGQTPVIAINRFAADTDEEIAVVRDACAALGVACALSDHFMRGAEGARDLARALMEVAPAEPPALAPLYPLEATVPDKIRAVAQKIYGADDIAFSARAQQDLRLIKRLGLGNLPVCIAKTQNSLSDNPALRGRPRDFTVTVHNIQINTGAGFLVVLTGDILRMPGLPRRPQAMSIDVNNGDIVGLR